MRRVLVILLGLLSLSAPAFASVAYSSVNATLIDGTNTPVPIAYLQFELRDCGYNVPSVPGAPASMVQKMITLGPSQLPANLIGNDEITCGNKYSTLWHVTAFDESDHPIAGDADYAICTGTSNCPSLVATLNWNLATAQPFMGAIPSPGFSTIFGNPVQSQVWTQPNGTNAQFFGNFDFTHANVLGLGNFVATSVFNAVRFVAPGNPQGWAGNDVGAWLQSADANCVGSGNASCIIQVASGNYNWTTTYTPHSNIEVDCAGSSAILGGIVGSATLFTWTGSSSGKMVSFTSGGQNTKFRHCAFTTSVGGTSTAFYIPFFVNGWLDDLLINGFGTLVQVTGDGGTVNESNGIYIVNSSLIGPVTTGLGVDHTANLYLSNDQFGKPTSGSFNNIVLDSGVNGVNANFLQMFGGGHHLVIKCTGVNSTAGTCTNAPGTGTLPYNYPPWAIYINQGIFDANNAEAVLFDSTLGASVIDFSCTACWAASSQAGANVHISGGQKIVWTGAGRILRALNSGILIDSANVADVEISDTSITNNNQANGAFDGVDITAAASNIRIINNPRIGNIVEPFYGATGHQKFGVKVTAAAPNLFVTGNNLNNNDTGAYSSTNTATQNIANNLPLVSYAVATLPTASSNTGLQLTVTDSTAIAAEGQTCAGSGAVTATAISNGTIWKCF